MAATSLPDDVEQPPPPNGLLGSGGDTPVDGQLVSWCYQAACADGLPPPRDRLPLVELPASGTQLTFAMPSSEPFIKWSVVYARRADDEDQRTLARGGPREPSAAPPGTPRLTEVSFGAPPSGSWVVNVSVWFPDSIGDAHYYWHVRIP